MQNRLPASASSVADNVKLAVLAIIIANLAFSLSDAAIKLISADFVLWQILVTRSIIAIPLLIAIILLQFGLTSLAPRHFGWVALRSLTITLSLVAYASSLPYLALGIAAVTLYTLPIFITLFAALFIGDRIGLIGWGSILLGFVGVALILKPTPDSFNRYALLPLIAAILYALTAILTRTKCREENPLVLSLGANFSLIAIGLLATLLIAMFGGSTDEVQAASFLFGEWSTMGTVEWLTMALLAAATIIASVGAAIAYQVGPSATVATFDFTYVGFAALWGFLFFAEVLDGVTLTGMALIIVAGVLAVRRNIVDGARP
jgi:drug/metabolite transporter (DMT)-like permease